MAITGSRQLTALNTFPFHCLEVYTCIYLVHNIPCMYIHVHILVIILIRSCQRYFLFLFVEQLSIQMEGECVLT